MSMGDIYLTREGYERLSRELERLKSVCRKEISEAIGQARLHGDISENAEYDAAKEAQIMNEKKIRELEGNLSRVQIIDDEKMPKDEVRVGAKVTLRDLDSGEEFEYMLVTEEEADYTQGKVSLTSPVGKALLGRKENVEVEINAPARILKYKIIKITR